METKFKQLDLVQNAKGELYVVEGDSWAHPGLCEAISLTRFEGLSYVSDKEERKICSLLELPTAVRALLSWRKLLGSGKSLGTHQTTAIHIIDELTMILSPEAENGSD